MHACGEAVADRRARQVADDAQAGAAQRLIKLIPVRDCRHEPHEQRELRVQEGVLHTPANLNPTGKPS